MMQRTGPLTQRALALGLAVLTITGLGMLLSVWNPFGPDEPHELTALIAITSPQGTNQGACASQPRTTSGSSAEMQETTFKLASSPNSDAPFDSDDVDDVIGTNRPLRGRGAAHPTGSGPPIERSSESYTAAIPSDFIDTESSPLSTFSIDVDTASYSNVRRFLREGRLPPPAAVRVEEMLNAFTYSYGEPEGEAPLAIHVETGACPWAPEHRLVHIGLQSDRVTRDERPPMNLVFLVDTSGSMYADNKLPLVKHGLTLMVNELDERDRVAIVTYAASARVHLASTSGANQDELITSIAQLHAGGSTNGGSGILDAYRIAEENRRDDGQNRVILATDGDFNVGITSLDELVALIKKKAESGVFLTTLGFGTGNLKDTTLEQLADRGNGYYAYIDSFREARRVFVQGLPGTLAVAAKDVKLQVEFNPLEVSAYRLVGYANRKLAARDFNDDTKDAGEVGLGHSVTALYEIVPANFGANVDALKYQSPRFEASPAAHSGELMTLKLRWKEPDAKTSQRIERVVSDSQAGLDDTSDDFRFAAAVAEAGMLLSHSKYAGNATFETALALAAHAVGSDPNEERTAFLDLLARAKSLTPEAVASAR
jgi:Ca-activated chloride channel family protein